MCKPIIEYIREARGDRRAQELHDEIGRLVWGARTKGFDDNTRSFEEIAKEKPNRLAIAYCDLDRHYRHHPDILVEGYLYKDVGMTYGPGGVAKTTTILYEHLLYAMGLPFDGHKPVRPLKTLFVSAEDTSEMYLAKVAEFQKAMAVTEVQASMGRQNIGVIYTGDSTTPWRLTKVEKDTVVLDDRFKDELLTLKEEFPFDVIVFDPAVSFGVGESRVNDAEQGLIMAARWLVGNCDCAVEFVHHTGKGKDRTGQYGYRGGSAFGDGARRVRSVEGWKGYVGDERDEFKQEFGIELNENQSGIRMSIGKLTYNTGATPTLIHREGFSFEVLDRNTLDRDMIATKIEDQMQENADKMHLYLALYNAMADNSTFNSRFISKHKKDAVIHMEEIGGPAWARISGNEIGKMAKNLQSWGCISSTTEKGTIFHFEPSVAIANEGLAGSPEDDF
jgi:RecA-family ATPase